MALRSESEMTGRVTPDQLPQHYNVSRTLLDNNIENGFGDKIAIYFNDQTITYHQLSLEVNKLGNLLKTEFHVTSEVRVALLLFDCPEFVSSFLAVIRIGAVAVPLSTLHSPSDYVYMLNDTRAALLIADKAFLDVILSVKQSLEYLKCILVVGDEDTDAQAVGISKDYQVLGYREGLKSQSTLLRAAKTNKNDAAFWGYTSGTTGRPKGTIHLQHDIYYAAYYLNPQFYDISPCDLLYSASKLSFSYGLGNSLWIPMFSGASVVLEPQRSNPDIVASNIRKYKPTKVFAVPTIYKAVYDYLTANRQLVAECQSVQRYYSAGEVLSKSLYDKWLKLTGHEILTVLGSTEALQGYIGAWPGIGNPGCLGRIIPGYEAKILDEEGHEAKPQVQGVLTIRGDSIASGYWNRHEESKNTFRGEWLYTGDMVYKTEDEIFWYVGRNDEMFKIAGRWVSPTEIEDVLAEHPSIRECAVISCDGENDLVTMVLYTVCKENISVDTSTEKSIHDFLTSRLPSYKCPRRMRFINELPRSSTGKLQRFRLKELNKAW